MEGERPGAKPELVVRRHLRGARRAAVFAGLLFPIETVIPSTASTSGRAMRHWNHLSFVDVISSLSQFFQA